MPIVTVSPPRFRAPSAEGRSVPHPADRDCHVSAVNGHRRPHGRRWRYRSANRAESVVENVVRDAPALRDAGRLVERPVDAEIDAALAILLLSLRKGRERPRQIRPNLAVV